MQLVIDVGNSRLKWNTAKAGQLLGETHKHAWRQDLTKVFDNEWQTLTDVEAVWLANVGGTSVTENIVNWSLKHWGIKPCIATTQPEQLGVINAYPDYTKLGVDRWLCLVAARQLFPDQATVIIDSGTATTVDVLTAAGIHLGGAIAPGQMMMQHALNQQTHAIKTEQGQSSVDNDTTESKGNDFGQSTEECIILGARQASVGFVQSMFARAEQALSVTPQIVLTGGNAGVLMPYMTGSVYHYPDLVLQGLLYVMGDMTCD